MVIKKHKIIFMGLLACFALHSMQDDDKVNRSNCFIGNQSKKIVFLKDLTPNTDVNNVIGAFFFEKIIKDSSRESGKLLRNLELEGKDLISLSQEQFDALPRLERLRDHINKDNSLPYLEKYEYAAINSLPSSLRKKVLEREREVLVVVDKYEPTDEQKITITNSALGGALGAGLLATYAYKDHLRDNTAEALVPILGMCFGGCIAGAGLSYAKDFNKNAETKRYNKRVL